MTIETRYLQLVSDLNIDVRQIYMISSTTTTAKRNQIYKYCNITIITYYTNLINLFLIVIIVLE